MKVALLCSGLGNIWRGHEIFARELFALVGNDIDLTLFKGGGEAAAHEIVVANLPRSSPLLRDIHLPVAPRWLDAMQEEERIRIETETFAHAALSPLLAGNFDVIHCLEREVVERLYGYRHLFAKTPKFLYSNGGALPIAKLPRCDFIQEHSDYNRARGDRDRSFVIPHGVDTARFHPGIQSDFRARHGIPADAFLVLSVGAICRWHKRMDYVIREVAALPDAWLAIAGQPCPDTPEIVALGERLMPGRIVFVTLPHDELPPLYAAADVFALGSLFETFGIVYVEAMAMGLPVFCTDHPNQRSIVREGVFIDMTRHGTLRAALANRDPAVMAHLAGRGPEIVAERYALPRLKDAYLAAYARIAATEARLPARTLANRVRARSLALIHALERRLQAR